MRSGWVYIVTNKAIPGLVKVGYTTRSDLKLRLQEFNQAGLPYPYEEAYALWVEEPRLIEQRTHQALAAHRENKEWFRCSVERAKETIKKIAGPESAKATIQKIIENHPGILTEFIGKDSAPKPKLSEEAQATIQKANAKTKTDRIIAINKIKIAHTIAKNQDIIAKNKAKIARIIAIDTEILRLIAGDAVGGAETARLIAESRAIIAGALEEEPDRQHHIRHRKQKRSQYDADILWGCLAPLGFFCLAVLIGSC